MASRFLTINLIAVDYDKVFKIDVEYDTLINELIDQFRQELDIPENLYINILQGDQQLDPSKNFEYYNFRQGVEIVLKTSSVFSARTEPQTPQVIQQQNNQYGQQQNKNQQYISDKIILVVQIPEKNQILNVEVDLFRKIKDLARQIKEQLGLEHTIQLTAISQQNVRQDLSYNKDILFYGLKKGDLIEAREIRISGFDY